jgi:phosphoribosyl-ATP pyrophosphohydrolase
MDNNSKIKCEQPSFSKPIENINIQLKNINLEKVTILEQQQKVQEEDWELQLAILEGDKEHIIEEFWDVVQAWLGLIYKYGITAVDVMKGYKKHLEKIKNRPRKKIKINANWIINRFIKKE